MTQRACAKCFFSALENSGSYGGAAASLQRDYQLQVTPYAAVAAAPMVAPTGETLDITEVVAAHRERADHQAVPVGEHLVVEARMHAHVALREEPRAQGLERRFLFRRHRLVGAGRYAEVCARRSLFGAANLSANTRARSSLRRRRRRADAPPRRRDGVVSW